jgi:5-formyltetrahydrofolate cyclo-ligase
LSFPDHLSLSDAKAQLRALALARRRGLTQGAREKFAVRLATEGLRLAELWRPRVISAFHPIRGEPDTRPMLAALAQAGFATALPVTVSRSAPLKFRLWKPGDPTTPGEMNIPEPTSEAPEVEPELLFTPLAAFDRRGHRIGFGAGHYDRTLALLRAKGRIYAIGVAFSVSEIDHAPNEPHDEPLDGIVTERELILPQGSAE